jgi:hypothetical protein
MIAALLARAGLGSIGLKGLAWLAIAAGALAFVAWLSAKLYLAGVYAERIRIYEETIAQIKADLAANEEIRKEAEADAAQSEQNEQKLKELIDALQNDKSCPLSREHIDGLRRIDESP